VEHLHRIDTNETSQYLKKHHGLNRSPKTLRNDRCGGRGPRWLYFGNKPTTTPQDVDEWVSSILTDRPPSRRKDEAPG
jgi:hypothetical protein